MLILSKAKITVGGPGEVIVEGAWAEHRARIADFVGALGIEQGSVRLRFGSVVFSREIPEAKHQRFRNFLVNECPVRR